MSTEAEIVEFEGRRYRVAGKSGPGVEPKVGMVVRPSDRENTTITSVTDSSIAYADGMWGQRVDGKWDRGEYEILALGASPPAETPRCEAPEWCGKEYRDLAVPAEWHGPHDMPFRLGRVDSTSDPAYCTQACADRARDAAGRPCHGCMGERGHHLASCPFAKTERKGPHVGASSRCWGYRPGTSERVRWQTTPDPVETREERWRRTHPGYGKPEHDMQTQVMMAMRGLTTFRAGIATMAAATNHKPAPWAPSDPEADIPWVWER